MKWKKGDFKKLKGFADKLIERFDDEIEKVMGLAGEKGIDIAHQHMNNQDLNWQPLHPRTVERKKKRSSDKILIDTSTYAQSITQKYSKLKRQVFIGVLRSAQSSQGQQLTNIARVHEFGSVARNIPKRPLWHPTKDEVKKWVKKYNPMSKIVSNLTK